MSPTTAGETGPLPILTVPDEPSAGPEHVARLEQVCSGRSTTFDVPGRRRRAAACPATPGSGFGTRRATRGQSGGRRPHPADPADGRRRTLHAWPQHPTVTLSMFTHIVPCGMRVSVTRWPPRALAVSADEVADCDPGAGEVRGRRGRDRHDVVSGPGWFRERTRWRARSCAGFARPGWGLTSGALRAAKPNGSGSGPDGRGLPPSRPDDPRSRGLVHRSARRRGAPTSTSAGPTAPRPSW